MKMSHPKMFSSPILEEELVHKCYSGYLTGLCAVVVLVGGHDHIFLTQVSYGDEKFPPDECGPIVATPTTDLLRKAKEIAQVCVPNYFKVN